MRLKRIFYVSSFIGDIARGGEYINGTGRFYIPTLIFAYCFCVLFLYFFINRALSGIYAALNILTWGSAPQPIGLVRC